MPDLRIFGLQFENNYLIAKFREKMKMPKLGPKTLYLGIFGLEF